MKKIDKRLITIILNVLIIIFEIIGIVISHKEMGSFGIQYYTEDSNFLLLLSSIISLIYLISSKKKMPKYLEILKYAATVSVTVTFLVVIFILSPSVDGGYSAVLFKGSMLYHHFICPILAIILFLFFENYKLNNKKEVLYSMFFSILYALIIVSLNVLKVIEGPYFFLLVYKNSVFMSIFYMILILGGTYLLSVGLNLLKKKIIK